MANESTLLVLLLILMLGLLIPELLKKVRLPFITLIILSGAIFGSHGLGLVAANETLDFFGFLGMTFLMLMAGLETNLSILAKDRYKVFVMAAINGGIPFLVGFLTILFFGYSLVTSLLVGIIFISSSVAIIIPALKADKHIQRSVAQRILAAIMIADIFSLVALGFIFQNTSIIANVPLPVYFVVLAILIFFLFKFMPIISSYALKKSFFLDEGYERQLRFVLVVLIGTLTLFMILGVHPILASFLSGLSLSGIIQKDKSGILMAKLHTLGFGIFVPVFFFIVGMDMDFSLFKSFSVANLLMISLILGCCLSKFFSGYLAGKLTSLSKQDSLVFGSVSITQLTTTLAVTYSAESLGLLDNTLVTSIILLAIITTFIGPVLTVYFAKK
jgi:Kef-type K+ transport system membrane component KefB